ncbi:MAG: septation ring formation regulator EzrA [candidate division KSB1 bacterium]|nr:septation ring formation regulator EzrA [candidate division KSB1 bacterium]MDZ7317842.1 septation ring formation regulator EzrA [candidate division KSB1 bacterium]MDZ7340336.1 septation ring formation regulator EzrA [candidate division KSB1 bacterium]
MSIKNLTLTLFVILALVMVIGCAKAPQQEVDAAKAALDAAKAAEADRYLPAEFNAVQDSLNAALAEIEKQNSKFALTRNYNRAKALLASVVTLANQAKDQVDAKKEEVKAQATQLTTDLQAALDEAKKLLKKAPRGKEGKAALEAMTNELTTVENSMADVTTLMNNGDFLSAKDKLAAGLAKVQSIVEELKAAIEKRYGKK